MAHMSFDRRIFLLILAGGLPGVAVSVALLWAGDYSPKVRWTLALLVALPWLAVAFAARERIVRSLQTLANLLAALREGDYSLRARFATFEDPMGEAYVEANALGQTLREQRLGAMEATALLRAVMAEVDVAVFAFDGEGRLRLANRFAGRLVGRPVEQLLGRTAAELGLEACLDERGPRTLQLPFEGGAARWGVRRSSFRQGGVEHRLLVMSNLTEALREEELRAWQRLVRVLSHELNNSLTPIQSIAGSLRRMLRRDTRDEELEEDLRKGLGVIESRSGSLARFLQSYARLARLPAPARRPFELGALVRSALGLETRAPVGLEEGPEVELSGDADQLSQALINLVRNAVDASLETGGSVRAGWRLVNGSAEVWIEDEGPGLAGSDNLFVPFFTTKPGGQGIGLALSRQIVEAHGGELTLENREDGRGCVARVRLPAGKPRAEIRKPGAGARESA
jgi:two-component system, NtrC family, nitrogen regulation sensor histidine kinase NtrY